MKPALVVLTSADDQAAHALVRRWADENARLLTPADLSVPGWRLDLADPTAGTVVVAGVPLRVRDVAGVFVRLARVESHHLAHVCTADRAYVAAEMTSFLFWWLTVLRCPVVNRPVAECLAGPELDAPSWCAVVRKLGIPARSADGRDSAGRPVLSLTVVGTSCVDLPDTELADWACRIARHCEARALRVWFDLTVPCFVAADSWVDIGQPAVADALRLELRAGPTQTSS